MWIDRRLKFEPSQYSNIKTAHLDSKKVWHPDFRVYNRYEQFHGSQGIEKVT